METKKAAPLEEMAIVSEKKTWLEAVRASFWEELIFKRCKADYVERKKAFS